MFGGVSNYFFLEFIVALLLTTPIFFVKSNIFDIIYFGLLLLVLTGLSIVNTNYYLIFGDIFSLQYISVALKGTTTVLDMSLVNFTHMGIVLSIWLVMIITLVLYRIFLKPQRYKGKYFVNSAGVSFVALFVLLGSYVGSVNAICAYEFHNKDNYTINHITIGKTSNFSKLGMLSYYLKEVEYLTETATLDDDEIKQLIPSISDNYYYSNVHGLLEGYNVLTIMIETGSVYMMNPVLTPNLYNLASRGLNFTNNYSKNKTNVSEIIGILGSSASNGIDYQSPNVGRSFSNSIPNNIPEEYDTYFMHDTDGGTGNDLYNRQTFIPQMGFENVLLHDELHPNTPIWSFDGSYIRDSITADSVIDAVLSNAGENPFYAFWTSLSMHGPYNLGSKNSNYYRGIGSELFYDPLIKAEMDGNWVNPLKNTINEDYIENFMMACMDFDMGLGKILNKLQTADELDNTLIVLYGDHDLYYSGADGVELNKVMSGHSTLDYTDIFQTTQIFYNERLTEKYLETRRTNQITQFSSPYNIVPSILDLLGVHYNPYLYLGDSVFSSDFETGVQVFYSYELSALFNDDFWSSDLTGIYRVFDETALKNRFLDKMREVLNRQMVYDKLYNSDYYFPDKD